MSLYTPPCSITGGSLPGKCITSGGGEVRNLGEILKALVTKGCLLTRFSPCVNVFLIEGSEQCIFRSAVSDPIGGGCGSHRSPAWGGRTGSYRPLVKLAHHLPSLYGQSSGFSHWPSSGNVTTIVVRRGGVSSHSSHGVSSL